MQEELDDARAVLVQVLLQVDDGTVSLRPNGLAARRGIRQAFAAQDLWVDPDDQDFLVVRTVENPDPAALRQVPSRAPQEIMLKLRGAGVLEAEHLAALGIH